MTKSTPVGGKVKEFIENMEPGSRLTIRREPRMDNFNRKVFGEKTKFRYSVIYKTDNMELGVTSSMHDTPGEAIKKVASNYKKYLNP